MNQRAVNIDEEIASIERKADQACSIHAWLRDRYQFRAEMLDYGLIAASTYLVGLAVVEPAIGIPLSFGVDRTAFISAMSLPTFFLSILQFKSDWKTKAQAHQRSFAEYAKVKADCRTFTSGVRTATAPEHQRVRDRYDMVIEVGTHIPDKEFVRGKAHHLRKVFVSKYLDTYPGAWLLLVHLKLFLRDNLHIDLLASHAQTAQDADQSR
jgi:hypothetical protein